LRLKLFFILSVSLLVGNPDRSLLFAQAGCGSPSVYPPGAIILSENFDELTPVFSATAVGAFTAINGTNVDIYTPSGYSNTCNGPESGHCIDLNGTCLVPLLSDGTCPNGGYLQGQLQSNLLFPPGQYLLSFDLIGSQRQTTASATVTMGNYNQTFTLTPQDFTSGGVANLLVTVTTPSHLLFTGDPTYCGSNCDIGLFLDNVVVRTVGTGAFSVLGLQGANVQFSSGGTRVAGNVGIGAGGQLNFSGGGIVQGTLIADPSVHVQFSGGSTIAGGEVIQSMTAIQNAALAEATVVGSLTPTQNFGQIQNSTKISGHGGPNVIQISGQVNLNGGETLTISGGPNDTFIIQVKGNFQLQGGSSVLLNGVSPNQVLFYLPQSGSNVNTGGNSKTQGIFLVPQGNIQISGGVHVSEFIASAVNLNGAPVVNAFPAACASSGGLAVTSPVVATAAVGVAYSSSLTATGGSAPYIFSIASGGLPPGLTLNSMGAITGTPTTTGPYSFTAQVMDSAGNLASSSCTITIDESLPPQSLLSRLGPSGAFSILGLPDPQHPNNGAQVNLQSSFAGSGTVGIGANGRFHLQGNVTLSNALYEDPSATIQIDGGSSITGGQTKESFAAIQSAAVAASATFAALAPTQTFSQQIQNATTITGNGGQNVISIANQINLNHGQNLIISGSSNDTFIFNIAQGQNFQLQNGSSIILQGVSPAQVLFNFLGNGSNVQIQSNNTGTSNSSGIFLDPEGQINIQGGTHNSLFISGNQIQISNNPTVNMIAYN